MSRNPRLRRHMLQLLHVFEDRLALTATEISICSSCARSLRQRGRFLHRNSSATTSPARSWPRSGVPSLAYTRDSQWRKATWSPSTHGLPRGLATVRNGTANDGEHSSPISTLQQSGLANGAFVQSTILSQGLSVSTIHAWRADSFEMTNTSEVGAQSLADRLLADFIFRHRPVSATSP
jgi:hypothetical protein